MEVPRRDVEDLRRQAADLLSRLNPKSEIPVPIERIVEFEFGLNIVPVPGLMNLRGINGFLTSDRTEIYVDEDLLRRGANRYFFTLAHELSHWILHQEHYEKFQTSEGWRAFHAGLEIHTISSAEWQADTLAGLLLVPTAELSNRLRNHFDRLSRAVRDASPGFDLSSEAFWSYIAQELGKEFQVSKETARIRLENDRLWRVVPPA